MSRLKEAALQQIIRGGETTTVEFKVAPPRPTELAERLCGMANAQGGLVIIGIEDNSLKIVGVRQIAVAVDVILRASRQIEPVLFLEPPEPEIYTLEGKQLVVATVPPNRGPLYQSSGVCWIRRGTHTIPLRVSELLEVANDRGLMKWELQPARKATMSDINMDLVRTYLNQRSERSHGNGRFDNLESVLIGMDCATVTTSGEVLPTNVGILFFGFRPQMHVPQSEVVCVLYRDELGVKGYIDRKIVTGTMQELIDQSEAFLYKYVAVGAKIEGWKRIDLPEYPIEALREAVVNAVVHRDYSRDGESVRIFFYSNRIEIHSPGLLLPGITVGQMARGEVMSKLRNRVLASLLRDVPGYMERIGSGIKLMLNEMRHLGLPDPQFREIGEFVVTFHKATVVGLPEHPRSESTLWSNVEAEQTTLLEEDVPSAQKLRMEAGMRYVREHGSITNREYRSLTGASLNTALRDLESLASQGALKIVGKRRGRHYTLP